VCEDQCTSGSSFTSISGPVRNPHDETRVTGGSSSGCAALVTSTDRPRSSICIDAALHVTF